MIELSIKQSVPYLAKNRNVIIPPAPSYFFGDNSKVGEKVIVQKITDRKKKQNNGKQNAIVIADSQKMIVVQYLKTGVRESFIKSDFIDRTVKFFN